MKLKHLKEYIAYLKKAYLNGTSFKDYVKELENISGLYKHHLKVVFNQNLRQVYGLARFKKITYKR